MTEGINPKKRTTIYVDPNIHKQFKEICEREDVSASQKIEQFEFDYVNAHCHGNPQTLLQTHFNPPNLICFRCKGKFRQLISVEYVSGYLAKLCSECLEKDRKRGIVKKAKLK